MSHTKPTLIASAPISHPSYAVGTDTASDVDARIVRELRQEIRDLDRQRAELDRERREWWEQYGDAMPPLDLSEQYEEIDDARRLAVEALRTWTE